MTTLLLLTISLLFAAINYAIYIRLQLSGCEDDLKAEKLVTERLYAQEVNLMQQLEEQDLKVTCLVSSLVKLSTKNKTLEAARDELFTMLSRNLSGNKRK